MRSTMLWVLAGLALAPAAAQAQDDDGGRDRGRDRGRCDCGLREVSDRRHDRRQGFWLAFGLGGGAESFDANDGLGWSDDKGGATGYLKLGGTVSQSLLLGAEANVWASRYRGQGYDRTLSSLMFIAQWYPAPRSDFWLRGGLGWAHDELDLYPNTSGNVVTGRNGTALAVGLGYDFRVSRNVSITPSLDLQGQRYRDHDERVVSFGIGVTFH